jgi:ATP-dependent exoDNAse (exonuclease V) beta subunit
MSDNQVSPVLFLRNKHKRDANIKFYAKGHRYYISTDKDNKYTSVTTWNHSHFPKFDSDKVIQNIFNSKNWGPDNKYWGMTADEIKQSWKSNGEKVANAGTDLHYKIEKFMNDKRFTFAYTNKELYEIYMSDNRDILPENQDIEWKYFIKFIAEHQYLKPYRTEWMIYDEELKLAGSIDMVFENHDGTLCIYDWKRSKEISKVNNWKQFATNPIISHLHDTNFWHYALQLNTYKAILERKYGKKVTELCLIRLHPDCEDNTYEKLEVPLLDKEIQDLFKQREEIVLIEKQL